MSYNKDFDNIIKPRKGDNKINIPITFDYNGGRKEYNKSRLIWVGIVAVIGLIIGVGIMTSADGLFILNVALGLGVMYGIGLIIRFPIMKEHIVRNNMLSTIDTDYKKDTSDIWGIYSVDNEYPYYTHLRNGYTAMFVRFEKDVILGRDSDTEYNHYEAIGDAYNLAGSYKIGMCHIDYMGVIGNDDRIDNCFDSLIDVKNPDMKDLLTDMYTNLQLMMDEMVTTFDVYVYTFKYSESTFRYYIEKVIACMLEANYVSFTILNADEIRNLTKSLFNMHDFSVMEACSSTFGTNKKSSVIPISIDKADGSVVVLNKTQEEKKLESKKELEEKASKGKKGKVKNKKGKGNSKKDKMDEVIDIFED